MRLNQGFQLPNSKVIEITPLNECINDEPGLHIRESINTSKNPTRIPIMIINETNRYYRLKKGGVVGKARPLFPSEISSVEPMDVDECQEPDDDLKEIKVPEGHRRHITQLVRGNKDLFAKRDKDLGHTDSVKMSNRTDPNQRPLKNMPYRTPLNKKKIIDQAIDKMLEAKVIEVTITMVIPFSSGQEERWKRQNVCRLQNIEQNSTTSKLPPSINR